MTRQVLFLGTTANDGTGDTMRSGGAKINNTLRELYIKFGGDSLSLSSTISITNTGVQYTSTIAPYYTTNFNFTEPTANRTISLPDESITIVGTTSTQTLTNKTLTTPTLTTPKIAGGSYTYNIAGGALSANRTINLPVATGTDTIVFANTSQTLLNKTLTTPTIDTPRIKTSIQDSAGAEVVIIGSTPSAVNEVTIRNAISGSHPSIAATGDNSNINLVLQSKGTGGVRANGVLITGSTISGDSASAALTWSGKLIYAAETVTSSGAVSVNTALTILNAGAGINLTLADGVAGQSKKFVNIGAGTATVTPTNFAHGTSFSIATKGSVEAVFAGADWYLMQDSDNKITITV